MDSNRGRLPTFRELIGLLLLAMPLLVTVSAMEAAEWVKGLPSLKALVLVSLVIWAFLARSKVPWWIGHPVAFLVGLVVAFFLGSFTFVESRGVTDLASQLGSWFGAIGGQEGNRGAAMTGVVLITMTLWMGHATVWLAYRRVTALMAALPGMIVLLIVLGFLSSDYHWYFLMYLLASAPGIAYRYGGRWSQLGLRVPVGGTLAALGLMAITLVPVWWSPAPEEAIIPLSSEIEEPWYSFRERWSNLFYGVPDRKHDWPSFTPPRDLPFTGPIEPGDEILLRVESSQPYRWRMRVYETYTSTGWVSEEPPIKTTPAKVPLEESPEELKARKTVEIGVRLYSKSRALAAVGEPLVAGIPSKVELSPQPDFKLYLFGSQVSYLPPEVRKYRDELALELISVRELLSIQEDETSGSGQPESSTGPEDRPVFQQPKDELRALGFRVTETTQAGTDSSETPYLRLERAQSSPGPPLALQSQHTMVPPRQYQTVGSISEATPTMLREAEQDYPSWVTDRYLQLTDDFPQTVKKLAAELAKDEDNPYDIAEALRRYLIRLPYSLDVAVPPPGQDWVEFFLLVERRGYCQNYASAMITMLRSLGIPARLVVGFAPGIWDPERGSWEVRSRHYHAWPEVYFPSYGWIEFEPTPSDVQPALVALGVQPQGSLASGFFDPTICPEEILGIGSCDETSVVVGDLPESALDQPEEQKDEASAEGGSAGGGLGVLSSTWMLLGLALTLALAVPVGTVSYLRLSLHRLGYPAMTYASMCFLGRLAGVGFKATYTPEEYCSRLSQAFPRQGDAITRVTQGFVSTRYGPSKELAAEQLKDVRTSWRTIRQPLLGRILIRLLPRRG